MFSDLGNERFKYFSILALSNSLTSIILDVFTQYSLKYFCAAILFSQYTYKVGMYLKFSNGLKYT